MPVTPEMTATVPTLLARMDTVESGCVWIADESVDVAVFSPPYFSKDGATAEMFVSLGALLARVLKPGARAFCVIGQVSENFDRIFTARLEILAGGDDQLIPWQTIAWIKSWASPGEPTAGHYTPINSDHLLYYGHELVFQFVKGDPAKAPPLAKLAVGVPYADESNLTRGTRGKNGNLHEPGDAWAIPYSTTGSTTKKAHRHAYPAELVRRLILLANLSRPGGVVLDPFIGGGTTAEVAREMGHHVVAVDRDQECIKALTTAWGVPPSPAVVTRPYTPPSPCRIDLQMPSVILPGLVCDAVTSVGRCGKVVRSSPSGAVCEDGHGGAEVAAPSPRRRRSKTLAALIAGDDGSGDPVAADGQAPHPDDCLNPPKLFNADGSAELRCGVSTCDRPLYATDSGDLCINGHGKFTGEPSRKKATKKKIVKKKATKR